MAGHRSPLSHVSLRAYAGSDLAVVRALHDASFSALSRGCYTPAHVAAHGVLIGAEDYADDLARSNMCVAETPDHGVVGTAGWLAWDAEPQTARIRKLFVAPAVARRGLGRRLLSHVEAAAQAAGQDSFFLRAYLNAVPLYESAGYRRDRLGSMALPGGLEMPVVFMRK